MTIEEKLIAFAKDYPEHFINPGNCPVPFISCPDCKYAWGDREEFCALDDDILYIAKKRNTIINNNPELFL